ncbi:MAG: DUF423 domain-containing protein [Granulosicoccaceae bacterium]
MTVMPRTLIIAAALFAALGIISGAFGAHALKGMLDGAQQGWFQKAVHYHQLAALGALLMALVARQPSPADASNGWILLLGASIFSATLYTMALGGPRWLGAVTPIGGSLMIFAWGRLAWQFFWSIDDE